MTIARYDTNQENFLDYLRDIDENELDKILSDIAETKQKENQPWRTWLTSIPYSLISYFYTSPPENTTENLKIDSLTQHKFKLEKLIKVLEGEDGIRFINEIAKKNGFDIHQSVTSNLNSLLIANLRVEFTTVKKAIKAYIMEIALHEDLTNSFIKNAEIAAEIAARDSVKESFKWLKEVKQQQTKRMNEKEELTANVNTKTIKLNLLRGVSTSDNREEEEKEEAENAKAIKIRMEEVNRLCQRSKEEKAYTKKIINATLFGSQVCSVKHKQEISKENEEVGKYEQARKFKETQRKIADYFHAEINTFRPKLR